MVSNIVRSFFVYGDMMSVAELQKYTFTAKYSRWIPEKKRRETWSEAIQRCKQMMLDKYGHIDAVIPYINQAYEAMRNKEILGSQRVLQFGGAPIFAHNARGYNCISSYVDRPRFFQECMYLLLCGCGTGFSVQKHHIAKLPQLVKELNGTKVFTIPDTIEGWADACGILINSYFQNSIYLEYEGKRVTFDYSKIRPRGAKLSSGATAPGPEPLKNAISKIRKILDSCIEQKLTQLRPIHAYDIIMHMSDAVLSGGIRRSATIALFSKDDLEMLNAKTGNWFDENPQRARSNNSVVLLRDNTTHEEFAKIIESTRQFGEPGFVWADSLEYLVNPCVSKDTIITTNNGLDIVSNLINKQFTALVNGKSYQSTDKGFWQTGNKQLLELQFSSGRKLKVTENHKLLTTQGWLPAGELTNTTEVIIHNHRENQYNIDVQSKDYAVGYAIGSFLSDGNVSDNTIELKWWGDNKLQYRADMYDLLHQAELATNHQIRDTDSNTIYSCISSTKLYDVVKDKQCLTSKKHLSKKAICGNWSYLSGLVAGYFDGDGTVAFNPTKGSSLRITSTELINLEHLQIVLNAFGIYSKIYNDRRPAGIYSLPDGHGGLKEYECQESHELVISCDSIQEFQKLIKIRNVDKSELINKICISYKRTPNKTTFIDTVVSWKTLNTEDVYDATIDSVHAFDANGVYAHNCVEVGFYCYNDKGESGWQACNLCTLNCKKITTPELFYKACVNAAIVGTLQAGFDSFPYLGEVSEQIIRREALLGVSMTGIMENPDICLDPNIQRLGAELIVATNKKLAELIGINQGARCTVVKPEGTSSCLLGCASGIHPNYAKRYIRRVQANTDEPVYQHFKKCNPRACENGVYSANDTDDVISFCIEVAPGSILKNQITAIELLQAVKTTQQNWVASGKVPELCTQPWLTHNVSNTITVKDNEWDAVAEYIYHNRQYFCGISLLGYSGDKDYKQAPFEMIHTPNEIISMYGDSSIFVSGLITKACELWEDDLWEACAALLGQSKFKGKEKQLWITKATEFANKYMDGDIKKLTYCLKDVYSWKQWLDLNREYKNVDYTQLIEETDNVKPEQEISCAGGACQI